MLDLATRVNRSNKFIDSAVLEDRTANGCTAGIEGIPRRVNEDLIEKASAETANAVKKIAVRKFISADERNLLTAVAFVLDGCRRIFIQCNSKNEKSGMS